MRVPWQYNLQNTDKKHECVRFPDINTLPPAQATGAIVLEFISLFLGLHECRLLAWEAP